MSQNNERPISKEKDVGYFLENTVDSLQRNKVDTIITVVRSVEGGFYDSIGIPTYKCYIFWTMNSKRYFQELAGYTDHEVVKSGPKLLVKTDIFYFLNSKYESLRNDFILPFIYKFKHNNIDCFELPKTTHGGYSSIRIYIKDVKISKGIDDLDLKDNLGDNLNINSAHNNQTELKKFWHLLWETINKERVL
ncbi:MAG TPA: hypothetical protein VK498_02365 [Ferruginibacter sp.]|nr:hypothetical protein [Ferruginibacter sp.]